MSMTLLCMLAAVLRSTAQARLLRLCGPSPVRSCPRPPPIHPHAHTHISQCQSHHLLSSLSPHCAASMHLLPPAGNLPAATPPSTPVCACSRPDGAPLLTIFQATRHSNAPLPCPRAAVLSPSAKLHVPYLPCDDLIACPHSLPSTFFPSRHAAPASQPPSINR